MMHIPVWSTWLQMDSDLFTCNKKEKEWGKQSSRYLPKKSPLLVGECKVPLKDIHFITILMIIKMLIRIIWTLIKCKLFTVVPLRAFQLLSHLVFTTTLSGSTSSILFTDEEVNLRDYILHTNPGSELFQNHVLNFHIILLQKNSKELN